jgi:hypothetical protein
MVNWGDPLQLPGSEADIQAASAPFGQFYGNPMNADQTFTWTTANVSDYIGVEGDVAIHWCGGGGAALYIDKLTLEYEPASGPAVTSVEYNSDGRAADPTLIPGEVYNLNVEAVVERPQTDPRVHVTDVAGVTHRFQSRASYQLGRWGERVRTKTRWD